MTEITINGELQTLESSADTPLLYVLRDELQLQGPRFGCGLAQCGSCSVLVNGVEVRSCVTPLATVEGQEVTTLEGLPTRYAELEGLSRPPRYTPVQEAIIDEQAIQCGYCYNGMIIKATELLENNLAPTEAEIKTHMNGHLCRCGTYPKIITAILNAAEILQEERAARVERGEQA